MFFHFQTNPCGLVHSHTAFRSRSIAHRLQANCARTSQEDFYLQSARDQWWGQKENKTGRERTGSKVSSLRVAVGRGLWAQISSLYADTNGNFLSFYAAISNSFIPLKRIFIKNFFYFLKNGASTTFWSYYCTKCKKSVVFVDFMAAITEDFIQISPRRGRSYPFHTGTSCLEFVCDVVLTTNPLVTKQ